MDLDSNGRLLSDGPVIRLIGHCVLAFAALVLLCHAFARLSCRCAAFLDFRDALAALRSGLIKQVAANPANASNRNDNPQQTAQGSSRDRCDILACAGTYRSFRANDCTYQPFDGGPRRLCEKSPGQRMAREQPDRRRWGGDAQARYLDRPASGRRFVDEDDDVAADFDYARREPAGFFIFGRRPRW